MSQTTPILVPISPGELLDKITILMIKVERLTDPQQRQNVKTELNLLQTARAQLNTEETGALFDALKTVNEQLWQIEDDIRDCEREDDFGDKFIGLARSVYHNNDERARLKREINERLGSEILEEKSYKKY